MSACPSVSFASGRRVAAAGRATALALLLTAIALALSAPTRPAQAQPIETVRAKLAELGIPEAQVREIQWAEERRSTRSQTRITGYEAYIRLTTCSGHLVIATRASGTFRDAYTRGDCRVPGLPAY